MVLVGNSSGNTCWNMKDVLVRYVARLNFLLMMYPGCDVSVLYVLTMSLRASARTYG